MEETFKKLNMIQLKGLCRTGNYKGFSKLKKKELIQFIILNQRKNCKICKSCNKKIYLNQPYINHGETIEHLDCYNLENKTKTQNSNECSICLDDLEEDLFITDCGHQFHSKCIKKWYGHSPECPNCRGDIYEILSVNGFIMKIDDKIKNTRAKIDLIENDRKKRKMADKLETDFRLIIQNFLDYYLTNTSEPRESAMNIIYTMIDNLGFN
jgi:hypothetical protein